MAEVLLIEESFPDHPALDVAVSHAVLEAVAKGEIGSVFRLHAAQPILAFGMADRIQPGYSAAVRIARAHRFTPVERLAGGRAAVFHQGTLAFSWAQRSDEPRAGITERFVTISGLMRDAFASLKVDARIGEIPGEYCPGRYSVNVGGTVKVMGVGQRLVKGAAHVGGVVVVDGATRIRDVLVPIYRALGIDWDPRTTGAIADRSAGTTPADVASAVVKELGSRVDLKTGSLPEAIVDRGRELVTDHLPAAA